MCFCINYELQTQIIEGLEFGIIPSILIHLKSQKPFRCNQNKNFSCSALFFAILYKEVLMTENVLRIYCLIHTSHSFSFYIQT